MPTATGLGSGLDIEALVTGLVAAERVPQENAITVRSTKTNSLLSGLGSLKSTLTDVKSTLTTLKNADTFGSVTTSSSSASTATITAAAGTPVGNYDLAVSSLASAQSIVSSGYASTSTVVGTGSLTISFGTPTYQASPNDSKYASFAADGSRSSVSIAITSANDELSQVRDAINAATDEVTASLVKDGTQYKLMLTSNSAGLANSLSVSVSSDGDANDSDASGLSALSFDATTSNLTQTKVGADAAFVLNGMSLTASSNSVVDVISGVTLNLFATTGSNVTLSVLRDDTPITAAVKDYVTKFNAYVETLAPLTSYDTATGTKGALFGDFTTRSIMNAVRGQLSATIASASGSYSALSQIGLTTQADGTIKFDEAVFNSALASDRNSVKNLFLDRTIGDTTLAGFSSTLETAIDGFVSTTGRIADRESGLNVTLKDIAEDQTKLDNSMSALEARYRQQFTTMDILIAEMTSTQDYLKAQLDALPGFVQKKD